MYNPAISLSTCSKCLWAFSNCFSTLSNRYFEPAASYFNRSAAPQIPQAGNKISTILTPEKYIWATLSISSLVV